MKYLIPFFLLAYLVSCNKSGEKPAALAVQTDSVVMASPGGCQGDSIPCVSFKVTFPRIAGLSKAAEDTLTQALARLPINVDNRPIDIAESGTRFLADWKEINEEFEGATAPWSFESNATVLIASDTLISIKVWSYQYTGGAHGSQETHYINMHPVTGARLTLDDFLRPGYLAVLTAVGHQAFREARGLTPDEDLEAAGFEFPDGFELYTNYGFSGNGIEFTFNIYEIGPYVLGPSEFTVPYRELAAYRK